MKFFTLIQTGICLIFLSSCSISKYAAPPFTDVDKILQLETGQSPKEALDVLKVKPYDIVYSHDKGRMLLIYNYRVKDRRMALPTKAAATVVHSEEAQRAGEVWYNKNYRELYLLFQDEKLKAVYGEDVLAVGGQVETMDTHLDNPGALKTSTGGRQEESNGDFSFAQNIYNKRYERKQTELNEDEQSKNRRKMMIWGGAGVVFLISLLLR